MQHISDHPPVGGTQLQPAGPVYEAPAYQQVQGFSLLQQDFGMPVQPALQQQGTDGTSLQSSPAQHNFAPSPNHLEAPTCKLLLLSVAFLLLCVLVFWLLL